MPSTLPQIRLGFRTSIIALFVTVVLVVGLSLVYLSFERVTSIIRSAAGTFIDKVAENAASRIDTQFKGVRDSVEILTSLPSVREARVDNPAINVLTAMLRNHTQLFNLYMGYDDGTFLEIDFIDRASRAFRDKLAPPPDALFRLFVIHKTGNGDELGGKVTFLSRALVPIAERAVPVDYDPRERPWYKDASQPDAGMLTDPYIFFASGEPGYTLRIPIREGRIGVVAGDILLSEAETILREQRLGRSGTAFLFNDADLIVAHPRMSALIEAPTSEGGTIALPRLSTVYKSGIPTAVHAWRAGGAAQQFFEGNDHRTYVVSFRSIDTAESAYLHIAVLAPLDEFFSTVLAQRRLLFLMALGFVLAALPPVFWLGSMLSRSIRAIAAETDRIQRFEPGVAGLNRSYIREIDDLGRSVSTMRKVVETFSSFVPKRLVQQLIETGTPLGLGGMRREVTIMFTDVTDFTALTEHARPESVMKYTSSYFATLSEAIMSNRGTVDKFIGDAVMAIWNAPAEDPDHVINACNAIVACQQATHELNERFARENWPAYRTRYGLHVGAAVVGNIGSADRMNYTVLGASVNLAARLESLNKNYGTVVLVSENIKQRAETQFLFRSVDQISPKGFAAKFPVFELRSKRETADQAELDFCRAWEAVYLELSSASPALAREQLDRFLQSHPGDSVARYHMANLQQRAPVYLDSPPT